MRPSLQRARFTSGGRLIRQRIAINYTDVAGCAAKTGSGDVDVRVTGRGRANGSARVHRDDRRSAACRVFPDVIGQDLTAAQPNMRLRGDTLIRAPSAAGATATVIDLHTPEVIG
jgi:hypothetical protein